MIADAYNYCSERVRDKSMKKIRDPAGIGTQDLLNTSQTLLPLSHLDHWQGSGRQATRRSIAYRHYNY